MLLLILLINGCIYNSENNTNATYNTKTTNFTTYTDTKFNLSVEYPSDWEIVQNESKVSFILPKKSKGAYTAINLQTLLSVDNGGKYKSTEDIISDLMQQFQQKTKNLIINYERESMLGRSKGKELSISYTLDDNINYAQTIIIAKEGNYFYALTYFSPSVQYDEYTYAYKHAKNSFKFEDIKI